jgi:hypothetical protein
MGAIKRDTLVLAEKSNQKGLQLARIVDSKAVMRKEKPTTGVKFKYYITFEGENRRFDQWIWPEKLTTTPEDVAKA